MRIHSSDILCILIVILALTMVFTGLDQVPFCPDEATQLYTSGDLEDLFLNPGDLAWEPDSYVDSRLRYRLLDSPLARLLIGLGRSLGGYPAPSVDWNWSVGWEENRVAGAVPSSGLLILARVIPSLLLPISLSLVYLTFRHFHKRWVGLVAVLLLAANPLVLLHARRAMAEAGMLFGLSLLLFTFAYGSRKPILVGVAAGIAINAKQSLIVMALLGLVVVVLAWRNNDKKFRKMVAAAVVYLLSVMVISFLLNPFLWKHPVDALSAAWEARQELLGRQVNEMRRANPAQVANTPVERAGFLLAQAYLAPPAAEDIGNYHEELLPFENSYFAFFPHRWLRGFLWGGVLLGFGLLGFLVWPMDRDLSPGIRHAAAILAIASFAQFVSLAMVVPLPFQRYSIPVVFFGCIWASIGVNSLITVLVKAVRKSPSPLLSRDV